MISPSPEKYSSNNSSKTGNSVWRFTMVARSAARKASFSERPVTSAAPNASRVSASDTRTPFSRSRFANSTSFSCMSFFGPLLLSSPSLKGKGSGVRSIQQVLVAAPTRIGSGAATRPRPPHIILQLFLRLAHIAFVLDDGVQGFIDQFLVEALNIEQRERLDPVERLADAGGLLEVELAQRLHHADDFIR